jgi:hypothetical protein
MNWLGYRGATPVANQKISWPAYEDFMELHNNQGRKQEASSKKSQMYDAGDV